MKFHLVSGGCGFVGRNMVRRLLKTTEDRIFMVDDLSIGTHPSTWFDNYKVKTFKDLEIIGEEERLLFWKGDFRNFLFYMRENPGYLQSTYKLGFERFTDVYHFAAIVGILLLDLCPQTLQGALSQFQCCLSGQPSNRSGCSCPEGV
jgi:nucleoside-diphosphate-sugar epimerase